jgi:hypothetical protein
MEWLYLARRKEETVLRIDLSSPDEAVITIRITPWMHGDGSAPFKKQHGQWVYDTTWYPL